MHEPATWRISVVFLEPRLTAGSAGPLSPTIAVQLSRPSSQLTSQAARLPRDALSPQLYKKTSTSPHLSLQRALAVPFNRWTPPGCCQSLACAGTASLGCPWVPTSQLQTVDTSLQQLLGGLQSPLGRSALQRESLGWDIKKAHLMPFPVSAQSVPHLSNWVH